MKRPFATIAAILVIQPPIASAFSTSPTTERRARIPKSRWSAPTSAQHPQPRRTSPTTLNMLSADDQSLAFWMAAFASSHIGMSAIRDRLIDACGRTADAAGLVGNADWILPAYWPGDDVGGRRVLPDADTAGRQLYRMGYTAVSFATLGSAAGSYLASTRGAGLDSNLSPEHDVWFWIAAASSGASIASLFNPSPLSLMPGFEGATAAGRGDIGGFLSGRDADGQDGGGKALETSTLPVQRNDSLKLAATGLTRITRHPLILPVIPWGFATALSLGARDADLLLFVGLALYAAAGCAAQDLRVSRREGSVGTTFRPDESSGGAPAADGSDLMGFFESTSFVPFGAVLDGRQSLGVIIREVPWIAFAGGIALGAVLQEKILDFLLAN